MRPPCCAGLACRLRCFQHSPSVFCCQRRSMRPFAAVLAALQPYGGPDKTGKTACQTAPQASCRKRPAAAPRGQGRWCFCANCLKKRQKVLHANHRKRPAKKQCLREPCCFCHIANTTILPAKQRARGSCPGPLPCTFLYRCLQGFQKPANIGFYFVFYCFAKNTKPRAKQAQTSTRFISRPCGLLKIVFCLSLFHPLPRARYRHKW